MAKPPVIAPLEQANKQQIMTSDLLSRHEWIHRTDAALKWLHKSIVATGNQGSAHSYSPLWGWAKAYPETTGYLIPTLLHYATIKKDESLRRLAHDCGQWLCRVQLPEGAFSGGLVGQTNPSVFNTGQILFGLIKLDEEILAEENKSQFGTRENPWRPALERAVRWMLALLEPDGAWRRAAYRPGFVPTYYTRAVWGVLEANRLLNRPEVLEKMRLALRYYAGRFQPDGTVLHWGFRPGEKAFTHTIAYTLEGFFESSLLLGETPVTERVIHSADLLLAERNRAGRTAGRYGARWQGDYTFRCLTGNAQLSVLFYRLWQTTGADRYRQAAIEFLQEIFEFQRFGANPDTYGALPGSAPVWGPYLRFRYPNWGVKFFLDAMTQ